MDINNIFLERARKLAAVEDDDSKKEYSFEGILFSLVDEIYMIEYDYINEIYPLNGLVKIPAVPDFIYGLLNIRSKVISVINLKEFFGFDKHEPRPCNRVVVLETDPPAFSILVDNVIGVKSIPKNEVQNSLPTLTGIKKELLKGFTKDGVIILDGKKIITSPIFKIDEKI